MNRVKPYCPFCIFWSLLIVVSLFAQSVSPTAIQPEDKTAVSFEEGMEFYLNESTAGLIEQLIANESQLLQLLNNIRDEIAARGAEGIRSDDAGFMLVNRGTDSLIIEYSKEMANLVRIYDNLDRIEGVAQQSEQIQLWENLEKAKNQVAQALEDRSIYKKRIYSSEVIAQTVAEYSTELDTLLSVYANLEKLEGLAKDRGDVAALNQVAQQKQRIVDLLSQWGPIGPLSDEHINSYVDEAEKILTLMRQADSLETRAETPATKEGLAGVKKNLVTRLDKDLLDLLTESGYKLHDTPRVSELVDTWKRERISDFNARLTQYQIIKKQLLETGLDKERDRMLARDLGDALLNYANRKYLLAENQLGAIVTDYSDYFKGLDGVHFYRAECQFARGAYTQAYHSYQEFKQTFPVSTYRVEAILRLMELSQIFERGLDFYTYFKELRSLEGSAGVPELSKAYYLAGNQMFSDQRFKDADEVLPLVSSESAYYLPSQLLLGVVEVNLDHLSAAIDIFENLGAVEVNPWSDANTVYVRNTALLRLGMIHYQRGEYTSAIQYFDQVSKGFDEYDAGLMAEAWANLRLGKYESSVEKTNELLLNSLASDYTYEALVLSAHCKRILDQPESALNSYRYVASARKVMELRKDYDQENDLLTAQEKELDRIEKEILDKRQRTLYPEVVQLKNSMNEFMLTIKRRADRGSRLIQDYYDERQDLIDHLQQLDEIVDWAEQEGRPDLAQEAAKQRLRLMTIFETYRSDQQIANASYLVDYPLAAKDANVEYRQEIVGSMYREMQLEARRIEKALQTANSLSDTVDVGANIDARADLAYWESELSNLQTRLNRFREWVVVNKPEDLASDIDRWSDMSGFGMSDIVYEGRKERLDRINSLQENIASIDNILSERRETLEAQMRAFQKRLLELQEEFLSKKIQYEKQEKKAYFENFYFDTKEKEEEEFEDRIRHLIEP